MSACYAARLSTCKDNKIQNKKHMHMILDDVLQ